MSMDRPISPPGGGLSRFAKRRSVRSAALLLVLGAGAIAATQLLGAASSQQRNKEIRSLSLRAQTLQISQVRQAPFESYVALRGRIQAEQNLALESLEGGRVEEVFVKNGDTVSPGQTIARIHNPSLAFEVLSLKTQMSAQLLALHGTQNSLAEAAFARKQALASVVFQRARWKRRLASLTRMQSKGAVGNQDVQEAREELDFQEEMYRNNRDHQRRRESVMKLQLKEMQNAADSLRESYQVAKERLESLTIKAPRAGEISQLQLELGATIQPGGRISSLLVEGPNKIEARVDEFFIDRLFVGQSGKLDIKGQGSDLEVTHVDPVVRGGKVRVDLKFADVEPEGLFRGQTVDLRLFQEGSSKSPRTLVLPRGAFFESRDGANLFVVNEDGTAATARPVRLGRSNRKYVEVLEGLVPGDRVITSSYAGLEKATHLSIDQ